MIQLPMSTVARYVAIGSGSSQLNVVFPACVSCDTSRPFETTVLPSGTVTRNVQVALSLGWSDSGIQVDWALGSEPTNAPSSVCRKPYGEPNTIGDPTIVCGTPPYSMRTSNVDRSCSRFCGVIWSSCPSRVKAALLSLTQTPVTSSCWRSTSKRESVCSAGRPLLTRGRGRHGGRLDRGVGGRRVRVRRVGAGAYGGVRRRRERA